MPPRVTRSRTRQPLGDAETKGDDSNGDRKRGTKRVASEVEDDQGAQSPRGLEAVDAAGTNGTGARTKATGHTSKEKEQVSADIEAETNGEFEPGDPDPTEISVRKRIKKEKIKEEEEEEIQKEQETPTKTTTRKAKKRKTKRTTEEELVEMKPLAPRTQGLRMYIGAHVSAAKGIHNAITNSVHVGGNALALFLKSQRKWDNPPLQDDHRDMFRKHCTDHTYDASKHILPHGSYLVNLAQEDPARAKQAYNSFLDDLKRCEELGIQLYNFHPGATNQSTLPASLSRLAKSLTTALDATRTVIPVLETTCGHGTSIGGPLSHFSDLFALIPQSYHSRLGVCLDTCHTFAAGYDLRSPAGWEAFMTEFDKTVGLRFLKALHVNDSKTPLGSRRDLHANIGTGFLGLRGFHNVMNDKRLEGLPLILETPIDRPAEQVAKTQDDEDGETKPKKKASKTKTPKNSNKPAMVEDKSVWAREIKLLESLIGMDPEGEEFRALEAKLAEEGKEERAKHQAQFDKKHLKEKAKEEKERAKAEGGGAKRSRKTSKRKVIEEISEEESELSSVD